MRGVYVRSLEEAVLSKEINRNIDPSPRSVIAVKKEFELPKASKQLAGIKIRHNKRFRGTPITRNNVVDFETCNALCAEDKKCVAFQFFKSPGECQEL
jgi:hypothetical protein